MSWRPGLCGEIKLMQPNRVSSGGEDIGTDKKVRWTGGTGRALQLDDEKKIKSSRGSCEGLAARWLSVREEYNCLTFPA